MQLNLRRQILLLTIFGMILIMFVVTGASVIAVRKKGESDLAAFRQEYLKQTDDNLKSLVEIAYSLLDDTYQKRFRQISDTLTAAERKHVQQEILTEKLKELATMRFDNTEGYFWITDDQQPYPRMIMHAEKKELDGQLLNAERVKQTDDDGVNIYQKRVNQCLNGGEAWLDYQINKPGTDQVFNKRSYSKYHKGLGWVISTGVYTDQIEAAVQAKAQLLAEREAEILWLTVVYSSVFLLIAIVISITYSQRLTRAVNQIKQKLELLAKGNEAEPLLLKRKDEIGDMAHSLNNLIKGLGEYIRFSREIGKGQLDALFEPLSERDVLGNSLLSMRDELQTAAQEHERRNWLNEGQARLAQVLREHADDQTQWYRGLIAFLVKYLNANQAGIFVVEELSNQEKVLELKACIAYNRQKYLQKTLGIEEGLPGRCVLEKSSILLTEIPEGYLKITSGLGESLPKCLILVPLLYNEKATGVIELAFFDVLAPHQVDFLEKAAETIAATLTAVQVNEHTRKLLEVSQLQAEEMRAQEEEMRQNNEELMATQEEMRRKGSEMEKLLEAAQIREQEMEAMKAEYLLLMEQVQRLKMEKVN